MSGFRIGVTIPLHMLGQVLRDNGFPDFPKSEPCECCGPCPCSRHGEAAALAPEVQRMRAAVRMRQVHLAASRRVATDHS